MKVVRPALDQARTTVVQCPPGMLKEEGRCLPHCSIGHFLQNAQCIACDGSCSSCSGPGRDQCLSCVQPGKVVSRGQCVEQCGHQSFLSNGICHVCPGECERCLPDSPQCETCSQEALFYKGRCLTTCPVGFYSDSQSACRACHPSCDGCKGGGDSNCTSCHGGARLSGGRCRMPCPPGQYLRMDGNCRREFMNSKNCPVITLKAFTKVEIWLCPWLSVLSCGPPDGGQTRCMMCTERHQVPVGPVCKDECGPGRYLDHNICQDCGKGCEVCEGPAVCLRCEPPYVLHNTQCVQTCMQGQFISLEEGMCQDCPENCVRCESVSTCQVCDSETHLLEGQCVQQCGPGHIVEDGVCHGNQFAPVFQVLGEISVTGLGQAAVVSPDLIYVSDEDTAEERLRLYVMETARNGELVKSQWGKDRPLGVEDTFTLQDLREKRIMFKHDPGRTPQGEVKLKVSDGQLFSLTRAVSIQVRSEDPMAVVSKGSFMAKVGLDTQLDSSILDVQSETSAYPVTISVLEGPRYGKLVHKVHKAVVTQFPLGELRSGNIMYRHDGTNSASSDMMVLQLTDGYNVVNLILQAEIREKDSKIPILVTNEMAYVQEKGLVKITVELLEVRSADTGATDQADLIYTLVPSSPENPKEGEILMVVPVPPGGVTPGWQSMKDGQMASPVFRFLQRDVEEGRIWYKNTAGKAGADSFRFEVSDMSVPPNILRGQTFHITIVPSPVAALDPPTLSPDTYLGMTVLENEVAFIGNDVLSYPSPEGSPADIMYRVTEPLGLDEGAIEHVDSPFIMLYRFTQEDIDKENIIYRPPITELGSGSREVQFKFVVTDEETGLRNPETDIYNKDCSS
ncbi:extracellular matrix organizing protein FRAS1-like [Liolophura sinensis]|uniref:extracellular matrix organizing protein FRAS1-like n=1 Tax=Liolophura sinensis TaxID=3198878 RepID=UPI0031594C8D